MFPTYEMPPWESSYKTCPSLKMIPACGFRAGQPSAVLDTGFNHNFLLQETHFEDWISPAIQYQSPVFEERLLVYGKEAKLLDADVWIHRNLAGHRDQHSQRPPFRLELDLGVAISPIDNAPRLPLLGLRALKDNNLRTVLNGRKGCVSMRTS